MIYIPTSDKDSQTGKFNLSKVCTCPEGKEPEAVPCSQGRRSCQAALALGPRRAHVPRPSLRGLAWGIGQPQPHTCLQLYPLRGDVSLTWPSRVHTLIAHIGSRKEGSNLRMCPRRCPPLALGRAQGRSGLSRHCRHTFAPRGTLSGACFYLSAT